MKSELYSCRKEVVIGTLPKIAYRLELGDDTEQKIEIIKELLSDRPDMSFVLYFNHISYNDPLLAAHIITKIDPKQTRKLFAPASYSHSDPDNPINESFSFMLNEARRCGIEICRVIQAYQVDNPEFGYTKEQARETYKIFFSRLKQLKNENVPMGFLISPEGHRSDTGVLGVGEKGGIITAGRLLSPTLYIPLGIVYGGKYQRSGFNIGKKIKYSIGNVTIQEKQNEEPTIEELMQHLAEALPNEMRGEWKR